MGSIIDNQKRAIRSVLAMVKRRPLSFIWHVIAMGVVFTLPCMGYIGVHNIAKLGDYIQLTPKLAVYFKLDLNETQLNDAIVLINRLSGIKDIEVVRKEDAVKRLNSSPDVKSALEMLPDNPFPDVAFITPTTHDPSFIHTLKGELTAISGIDTVIVDTVWIRRLIAGLAFGNTLITVGIVAFSIACLAMAFALGRFDVMGNIEELRLAKLLGGDLGPLRRPFVWLGFIVGAAAALFGAALSFMALAVLQPDMLRLASEYQADFHPSFIPLEVLGILILIGAFIGAFGSWLAVRSFNPDE